MSRCSTFLSCGCVCVCVRVKPRNLCILSPLAGGMAVSALSEMDDLREEAQQGPGNSHPTRDGGQGGGRGVVGLTVPNKEVTV